jgi:hypothetical protein
LVGTIKFTEEFRGRLAKNYDFIEAIGDAWTLGVSKSFIKKEALKSLLNPLKLLQYLARWYYIHICKCSFFFKIYTSGKLTKPIFRYWCVSLSGFCKKLKIRQEFKDF